jgi:hypothetical protein
VRGEQRKALTKRIVARMEVLEVELPIYMSSSYY